LEALDYLHQRGLVHRDIKPSNVIFVNDLPKLADVGLVRDISPEATFVGTPGYMPPGPEPLGTKAADIYAMGKLLYVTSTGKNVNSFSELSTTLVEQPEFMRLNEIICRACQPAADQRYASAAEMLAALRAAQGELGGGKTVKFYKNRHRNHQGTGESGGGKDGEFYSTFVSYSSKDEDFAKHLHADLEANGVRCWFAPEDLKTGEEIRTVIDERIRDYDKLLLILSKNSVKSVWVKKEVESAFRREEKEQRQMLFPIRIDDAVMEIDVGWAADVRARNIADFTKWKEHSAYQVALQRLLRDLTIMM
jgi:serine/threonine protein kinase